jgi:transposase
MKEEIRQIYQGCRTFRGAERKFEKWIRIGGILYQSSASMIQKHLLGICNYFENHTTNGLIEGMNTKIKLIKRMSYGFTNFEHLRLIVISDKSDTLWTYETLINPRIDSLNLN